MPCPHVQQPPWWGECSVFAQCPCIACSTQKFNIISTLADQNIAKRYSLPTTERHGCMGNLGGHIWAVWEVYDGYPKRIVVVYIRLSPIVWARSGDWYKFRFSIVWQIVCKFPFHFENLWSLRSTKSNQNFISGLTRFA